MTNQQVGLSSQDASSGLRRARPITSSFAFFVAYGKSLLTPPKDALLADISINTKWCDTHETQHWENRSDYQSIHRAHSDCTWRLFEKLVGSYWPGANLYSRHRLVWTLYPFWNIHVQDKGLSMSVIVQHPLLFLSFRPKGPPCPPWRDRKRGTAVFQHPGLGQGRDTSCTMPREGKPGLGQGKSLLANPRAVLLATEPEPTTTLFCCMN
jgi:hypothetical protein